MNCVTASKQYLINKIWVLHGFLFFNFWASIVPKTLIAGALCKNGIILTLSLLVKIKYTGISMHDIAGTHIKWATYFYFIVSNSGGLWWSYGLFLLVSYYTRHLTPIYCVGTLLGSPRAENYLCGHIFAWKK